MRILVVEDDPALLKSLAATLREENYAIDTASDGETGLLKAREQPYDAIVLDVLNDRSSTFHPVEIAIVAWVDFVSGPEWSVRGGLLLERL